MSGQKLTCTECAGTGVVHYKHHGEDWPEHCWPCGATGQLSPLFEHDCSKCIFLGIDYWDDRPADLYYCPAQVGGPTVIARYGNDGPAYCSGMEFALAGHAILSKALALARQRGLVQERGLV